MEREAMRADVMLEHGAAVAGINLVGAEPCVWTVAGRDLLWPGDARSWQQRAPILFPIVGRLRSDRVRIGGDVFSMGVHGFARTKAFTVLERTRDHVRLRLTQDTETMAAYPFPFALTVDYRLTDTTFSAAFTVANPGGEALPYALGFHPGFRWPFADGRPEQYALVFQDAEVADVPVITADGLFSTKRRLIPFDGRSLPLSRDLMAHEAICFLDARSTSVRFVAPDGSAIAVATDDFPHLALWSRPPAPFLCIEAWTGHGDPADFDGDLAAKPSMRWLAPGTHAKHAVHLCIHRGGP
jgi:galactose mutarotase-like enzyme